MTTSIELRSARDGLKITLSNFVGEDPSSLAESFLVTVNGYEIHATTRVSSFRSPSLAEYFQDIADNWRGWEGEKYWSTLESDLEFKATSDKLGHVRLEFSLKRPYTQFGWVLQAALELEAGQLDAIAANVRLVWPESIVD
jgi:Family of unknown function (DUF6228)